MHKTCYSCNAVLIFWEFKKVSLLTICYFPKIAKKLHTVLFVWYYRWRQCSGRRLLSLQSPQYTQPLYLLSDKILCFLFLTLGKLGDGVLLKPFIERRLAYFSSHLRCQLKATHIKWRSCSNFFDGLHLDACNCVWQLTGDCFLCLASKLHS